MVAEETVSRQRKGKANMSEDLKRSSAIMQTTVKLATEGMNIND